jgi:hypothetical protein
MTGTLHLAAWNLNHRTGKKAIPPAVIHAIAAIDIDVLVLTEFVDGDHQVHFKDRLKDIGFESLAADDRTGYWSQVEGIARTARDRRVIFLGDFYCDPFTDTRPCTQVFPRLQADGFRLPEPKGDWSYHSGNGHGGSRIDHALASPAVVINEARYLYKAGRHLLAGQANGTTPLSDHALLSIRIARPHEPAHPHASLRLT